MALAGEPAGFEYVFTAGQNSGAFGTKSNFNIGGSLNVPIFGADPLFGQALLGEVLLGYAKTKSDGTFNAPAVTGLGLPAEPTPATRFSLTTTQIGIGVKYKFTFLPALGFIQIQPYIAGGVSIDVFLSKTNGNNGDRAGGIAPISPDLAARGVPAGQGNVLAGPQFGGGLDIVLFKNLLLGFDARRHLYSSTGANYTTLLGKVGFRF
ncbi:MAG: hypothetical protein NVS9B10_01980 [Nevskia sp.]